MEQASLAGDAAADALCPACVDKRPEFARAVAHGVYEGELRGLLHLLKYDGMTPIARRLGERLAPHIASLPMPHVEPVLVVPVPLHTAKRRSRGFNQSELIARGLVAALRRIDPARRWRVSTRILARRHATESQARLSPQGRRRTLRGACTRALLRAGAAQVWVATVARAQREGAAAWTPFVATAAAQQVPSEAFTSS